MTEWPLRPLPEACEINPRLPRDHRLTEDTPVSFVPMSAVDEVSGTISAAQTRPFREVRKGYTWFTDGDVLFAKITPCMENGKAALAAGLQGGVGFGSTEFHVLRPREGVLSEWVRYFVRRESFRKEAKRNFTGTGGQQRVPVGFLERAMMPVPPLAAQRRIVDILSRAEGILRLRREAEKKAAELVPAIFLEMFGDPATNPKGLPIVSLSQVAEVQGGLQVTRKRTTLPLERPYLRVANVYRSRLDLSELKTMRITEAELKRTRLEPGDLLIVEGHGNPNEVGRVAVWDGSIKDCSHQNHLIRARPNRGALLPEYASAFMNSAGGRKSLRLAAKTTSGLSTISAHNVRNVPVMLPPIADQRSFVMRIEAVQSVARLQKEASKAAAASLEALLARNFSRVIV